MQPCASFLKTLLFWCLVLGPFGREAVGTIVLGEALGPRTEYYVVKHEKVEGAEEGRTAALA